MDGTLRCFLHGAYRNSDLQCFLKVQECRRLHSERTSKTTIRIVFVFLGFAGCAYLFWVVHFLMSRLDQSQTGNDLVGGVYISCLTLTDTVVGLVLSSLHFSICLVGNSWDVDLFLTIHRQMLMSIFLVLAQPQVGLTGSLFVWWLQRVIETGSMEVVKQSMNWGWVKTLVPSEPQNSW